MIVLVLDDRNLHGNKDLGQLSDISALHAEHRTDGGCCLASVDDLPVLDLDDLLALLGRAQLYFGGRGRDAVIVGKEHIGLGGRVCDAFALLGSSCSVANHRVTDAFIGSALELQERPHVLLQDLLVILVVNLRKNRTRDDAQVAVDVLRDVGHLDALQRVIIVSVKVNHDRVFARQDIVLTHHALGIPDDIFTGGPVVQLSIVLVISRWSNGIGEQEQTHTVNLISAVYQVCDLIQITLDIINLAEHCAIDRLFVETHQPVEMAVKLGSRYLFARVGIDIDRQEQVN